MSEPSYTNVPWDQLQASTIALFRAAGSDVREAQLIAEHLVEANLRGHDSHGVGVVPMYLRSRRFKGLVLNQKLNVAIDTGAMLICDAGLGAGQVMAHDAMVLGIERARDEGSAIVSLRNSHHIGRIGQWAENCAAEGMVSIHFVNALLRPLVAPFGGSDARFATNPFCVGVPRDGAPPVILDFATSRIALGKVRVAMQSEKEVAPGTLIDAGGHPTGDPRVMFEADAAGRLGAILPFGEHKGYGMALICEILGGALSGGETLHESAPMSGIYNNMLSIVIDPARLSGGGFHREMEAFIAWVRESPVAPGFDRVRIAGEPELEMRARRAGGIPIDVNTWADMQAAARKAGVSGAEAERFAALARPE